MNQDPSEVDSNVGNSISIAEPSPTPGSTPGSTPQPSVDVDNTAVPPNKRAKNRTAACWLTNWFKLSDPKKYTDGKPRAECTKCGRVFMADTAKNGTSNLNKHMSNCPKRDNKDIAQMIMQPAGGKLALRELKIDPVVVREMVLRLVVRNELPLRFVEYGDFRKLMLYIYPEYASICRNTLLNDIHKVFKKEKNVIREAITDSVSRVSVTTDLWTSISNDGYMTLTAHYIDKSWVLHKKLIKFTILTPPHSGVNIGEAVRKILIEWGLEERLFSITVDNASANDVGVSFLRNTLNAKNALLCNGEFFHIRCCAHILNLIVQNGIKLIDTSVQKVRDSIKYIKSSQARKIKFEECCDQVGLNTSRGLHGDVVTRWNSTFKMLDDALHYRKAFETLDYSDPSYTSSPLDYEWEKISKIIQLLLPFDEITNVLSGSKYPTSSLYFPCVVEIQQVLNDGSLLQEVFMEDMIRPMREKFNKYWEKYSLILSIAVVLDPRYKLNILKYTYNKVHRGDNILVMKSIERVKEALDRLYEEYKSMPKEEGSSSTSNESGPKRKFNLGFFDYQKNNLLVDSSTKSDLNLYLEEKTKPLDDDFDVLAYWNVSETQFPDLARLARDILAIPVSTVASESAFSAGSRVIDKYRSKLLPKNVEALICLRDWMCDVNFGAEPDPDQDDFELAEALGNMFAPFEQALTEVSTNTIVDVND